MRGGRGRGDRGGRGGRGRGGRGGKDHYREVLEDDVPIEDKQNEDGSKTMGALQDPEEKLAAILKHLSDFIKMKLEGDKL